MLLNRVEKTLMNNPVRARLQRSFEADRLLAMGGPTPRARALEIGCGRGVGTEIILDRFGAAHVDAFDLDPHMVAQARARLAHRGDQVRVTVGDAERLPAEEGAYDAVFDFAILHHLLDWRQGLREVARVLRPGGRLYAEEVLRDFIRHPLWRAVLDHPQEDRFDARQFGEALEDVGLRVLSQRELGSVAAWFVAEKPASRSIAATKS
jgi:ubiquinone/menaquinone biosynthesis C-methylase UbiE